MKCVGGKDGMFTEIAQKGDRHLRGSFHLDVSDKLLLVGPLNVLQVVGYPLAYFQELPPRETHYAFLVDFILFEARHKKRNVRSGRRNMICYSLWSLVVPVTDA